MRFLIILVFVASILLTAWAVEAARSPILLHAPNGGEIYVQGHLQVVKVEVVNRIKSISIELSRDGGLTYVEIGRINNQSRKRMHIWEYLVEGDNTIHARIRVTGIVGKREVSDRSGEFIIGSPKIASKDISSGDVSNNNVFVADGVGGVNWVDPNILGINGPQGPIGDGICPDHDD